MKPALSATSRVCTNTKPRMMYRTAPERPLSGPSTTSTMSPTPTSLPPAPAGGVDTWGSECARVCMCACGGRETRRAGDSARVWIWEHRQKWRCTTPPRPPRPVPNTLAAAAALSSTARRRTSVLDTGPPVVHLALDVGQAAQAHVRLVGAPLQRSGDGGSSSSNAQGQAAGLEQQADMQ